MLSPYQLWIIIIIETKFNNKFNNTYMHYKTLIIKDKITLI